MVVFCKPCGRLFAEYPHYLDHITHSPRHHYCKPCDRHFVSESAKEDHLDFSAKHRDNPKNLRCRWCATQVDDFLEHNEDYHVACSRCHQWFEDQDDLHDHLSSDHSDVYCSECHKLCMNENNLKIHMASSIHVSKDIACPHPDCKTKFLSIGCLIAHFESGGCPSGMDLNEVEKYFSRFDKEHKFVRTELLRPAFKWEIPAEDCKQYRCPFCPKMKLFKHRSQLEQHLKSPKHQNRGSKPFVCPSGNCVHSKFRTLGGLLQHREMGNCGRGHNTDLKKLCVQLLVAAKESEFKRELEIVRQNLEKLMTRFVGDKDD